MLEKNTQKIQIFHRDSWLPAEPRYLENLEIWILSVQVQKEPGICIKKWENQDKTWTLAENMDKTCTVQIYNILILYWEFLFQYLYFCNFKTPLVSAFWWHNCPHYITWRMPFLTWTSTFCTLLKAIYLCLLSSTWNYLLILAWFLYSMCLNTFYLPSTLCTLNIYWLYIYVSIVPLSSNTNLTLLSYPSWLLQNFL